MKKIKTKFRSHHLIAFLFSSACVLVILADFELFDETVVVQLAIPPLVSRLTWLRAPGPDRLVQLPLVTMLHILLIQTFKSTIITAPYTEMKKKKESLHTTVFCQSLTFPG